MISSVSRHNIVTLLAPLRAETLAASIATLPPPTTTISPSVFSLPTLACFKNSTAVVTPIASCPGIFGNLPPWQPIAR